MVGVGAGGVAGRLGASNSALALRDGRIGLACFFWAETFEVLGGGLGFVASHVCWVRGLGLEEGWCWANSMAVFLPRLVRMKMSGAH